MSTLETIKFIGTNTFDAERMRQYLNGELSVFHCHHYSGLFTQLADDAKLLHGAEMLCQAGEESFYPVLTRYFKENQITSRDDRISITEQYFQFVGLGNVSIDLPGKSGKAEMSFSHIDEAWLKKWSKRDKPVNFIGQGFLAAAAAAINNESAGSYVVQETRSIVSGAPTSQFTITHK